MFNGNDIDDEEAAQHMMADDGEYDETRNLNDRQVMQLQK